MKINNKFINVVIVIVLLITVSIVYFTKNNFSSNISNSTTQSISSTNTSSTNQNNQADLQDISSGLKQTKWGNNITISYTEGKIQYKSNGLPNHARQALYALPVGQGNVLPTATTAKAGADPSKAQSYDFTITTKPKKADKTTSTSLGVIGLTISGAALYNPYEGDNKTVAVSSNFTVKDDNGNDVAFLDNCNGHPTPMGAYHYHALPKCITTTIDTEGGPSHILGIALDGFPIYGDRDINGRQITIDQLDSCNGITSPTPEFVNSIYHYVLPDTKDSTSSIRCFSGVVDASLQSQMNNMGGMGGGMPPMR